MKSNKIYLIWEPGQFREMSAPLEPVLCVTGLSRLGVMYTNPVWGDVFPLCIFHWLCQYLHPKSNDSTFYILCKELQPYIHKVGRIHKTICWARSTGFISWRTSKFVESKYFQKVSVAFTFLNKENTRHLNLSFISLCFFFFFFWLLWSRLMGCKKIRPLPRFGLSDIES